MRKKIKTTIKLINKFFFIILIAFLVRHIDSIGNVDAFESAKNKFIVAQNYFQENSLLKRLSIVMSHIVIDSKEFLQSVCQSFCKEGNKKFFIIPVVIISYIALHKIILFLVKRYDVGYSMSYTYQKYSMILFISTFLYQSFFPRDSAFFLLVLCFLYLQNVSLLEPFQNQTFLKYCCMQIFAFRCIISKMEIFLIHLNNYINYIKNYSSSLTGMENISHRFQYQLYRLEFAISCIMYAAAITAASFYFYDFYSHLSPTKKIILNKMCKVILTAYLCMQGKQNFSDDLFQLFVQNIMLGYFIAYYILHSISDASAGLKRGRDSSSCFPKTKIGKFLSDAARKLYFNNDYITNLNFEDESDYESIRTYMEKQLSENIECADANDVFATWCFCFIMQRYHYNCPHNKTHIYCHKLPHTVQDTDLEKVWYDQSKSWKQDNRKNFWQDCYLCYYDVPCNDRTKWNIIYIFSEVCDQKVIFDDFVMGLYTILNADEKTILHIQSELENKDEKEKFIKLFFLGLNSDEKIIKNMQSQLDEKERIINSFFYAVFKKRKAYESSILNIISNMMPFNVIKSGIFSEVYNRQSAFMSFINCV
jgi:hypothetical protein